MTWIKSWSVGLPIVLLVPGLAIAQLKVEPVKPEPA